MDPLTISRKTLAAAAAGVAVALAGAPTGVVAGQKEPAATIFTAEQATTGKAAYGRSCAGCHMPDLGGTPDAPPLAGSRFFDSWRARTSKDLFDFVSGSMPPGGSSMNADAYAAVLAYVFQANGALPGTTRLEPSTVLPLERVIPKR
jgi:mono/diheme cytochrome c family protein